MRSFVLTTSLALALSATAARADELAMQAVLANAQSADFVMLGEVHDNPAHHALQTDILAELGATAIIFEMLTEAEAARVTRDLALDPVALAEVLAWDTSGWPAFEMYYPLLALAASTPIFGAEVERSAARRAFAEGAAAVIGASAPRFGLDRPLPEAQQATREAQQNAAHCDALPAEILPAFVEAQRLRDAALAESALAAHAAHGAPVAIITGNGHARDDWGVPALLEIAAPGLTVISLGQFEAIPAADAPFTVVAVADPVARPDPCTAFR